jgi:hypothetical protein
VTLAYKRYEPPLTERRYDKRAFASAASDDE